MKSIATGETRQAIMRSAALGSQLHSGISKMKWMEWIALIKCWGITLSSGEWRFTGQPVVITLPLSYAHVDFVENLIRQLGDLPVYAEAPPPKRAQRCISNGFPWATHLPVMSDAQWNCRAACSGKDAHLLQSLQKRLPSLSTPAKWLRVMGQKKDPLHGQLLEWNSYPMNHPRCTVIFISCLFKVCLWSSCLLLSSVCRHPRMRTQGCLWQV